MKKSVKKTNDSSKIKKSKIKSNYTHASETDANLYPPKRQLTKASEPLFDLEGGAQGQI